VRLQIHRSSQNKTAQGTSLGPSSSYFFQRELSGFPTGIYYTSESSNRQDVRVSLIYWSEVVIIIFTAELTENFYLIICALSAHWGTTNAHCSVMLGIIKTIHQD